MKRVQRKALKLRRKGYSYNEINKELGVPKSTLSGWLKNVVLSYKARERLQKRYNIGAKVLTERNKAQTQKALERALSLRKEAAQQIKNLDEREILLIGSALYWAEGYKRPRKDSNGNEKTAHSISFTNSDPEMISLFILFLRKILNVPPQKIRLEMRLYSHTNKEASKIFWKRVTGLGDGSFTKTTYLVSIASKRRRKYNRLPYGTLAVAVDDTKKFHSLMGFIEGLKNVIK